jgi:hypothetical protein
MAVKIGLAVSPEAIFPGGVGMHVGFKLAGFKLAKFAGLLLLCLASVNVANALSDQAQRKTKKQPPPPLPPLPSGPTGPIQSQVPLDAIAPVSPQVSYQNGELTIVAPNSTLGDILRAVRKQTGAEIEIPEARERVVTHLGPGLPRDIMAELLNGSRFNYVLLGSPQDPGALTRVVLVAKTGPDSAGDNNRPVQQTPPGTNEAANMGQAGPQSPDAPDAEPPEENAADDNADQPVEAEQPANPGEQPEVKTPQQMLQEMQQRQLQMQQQMQQQQQQQQQPPGQPPLPGQPNRPPQDQN